MASWTDHVIWWHVYPLGFTGALGAGPGHRLRGLEAWLDYAVELGCNGLALGPVFASETHGYDTVDHLRVDPRLGDDAEFDHLVMAARDRGMRILLDGVFNHVGRGFPQFTTALRDGPGSPAARWFRPRGDDYDCFEGHRSLVALNHDEPAVAEYVTKVMRHWLDRGVDGWRLDAAYAVPAGFWRTVLPQVRSAHPDAWFTGEMIHGDYAGYVAEAGLDSVTQYELWKAIWSSLNDQNLFELAWALERHDRFAVAFPPSTFVGNHDVTRIATRLEEPRRLAHALVVLFTVAGVPAVYYGDEQAFQGLKEDRPGGDDAVRPEFPASPGDLAGWGRPVYRLHQRLIGLRRRHPWLVRARTEVVHLTSEALALRSRPAEGGPGITVLLNIGADAHRFPVPVDGPRRLDSSAEDAPDDPAWVPAYGWAILGA